MNDVRFFTPILHAWVFNSHCLRLTFSSHIKTIRFHEAIVFNILMRSSECIIIIILIMTMYVCVCIMYMFLRVCLFISFVRCARHTEAHVHVKHHDSWFAILMDSEFLVRILKVRILKANLWLSHIKLVDPEIFLFIVEQHNHFFKKSSLFIIRWILEWKAEKERYKLHTTLVLIIARSLCYDTLQHSVKR